MHLDKIGISMMVLGAIVITITLLLAKKNRSFEAMKELKRIRTAGYTTEHQEERSENYYKTNPTAGQARLLSRRAQRVLERMDEPADEEEVKSSAPGTMYLEEITKAPERKPKDDTQLPKLETPSRGYHKLAARKKATEAIPQSDRNAVTSQFGIEETAPLAALAASKEMKEIESIATAGTAVLDEEVSKPDKIETENTAVLEEEIPQRTEAKKIPNQDRSCFPAEAAILKGDTAALDDESDELTESTAILEELVDEMTEKTAPLADLEKTAPLTEKTAALDTLPTDATVALDEY